MDAPREVELKLELDGAGLSRLRTLVLPELAPAEGETRRLVSSYFDTRKRTLAKRGLSLRVRQDGDRRIQTLKADGPAGGGLFDRPEWECDVVGDEPDLAEFGGEARRLATAGGALGKVFETTVDRTAWTVERDGSSIEVVVDEGEVSTGQASGPIAEIEMELKQGSPADLFRLARTLGESASVRLGVQTKSERGYALVAGERRVGIKAEPVALQRRTTVGEAFQRVARSCLRHFRLNEPALVADRAVEALHQSRVALRRLRSAFSIFKAAARDDEFVRLGSELRDVSRLLGDARNLDVLLARMADPDPGGPDARERLAADRERAYDQVLELLESQRFRFLMLDLAAWVEAGPWLTETSLGAVRDARVSGFAADVLHRQRRKVTKSGRHLDRLDPDARHQVRIEAKKLRYASEFFAGLVKGGKGRRRQKAFLSALEDLQSCLGDLNDLATARELTAGLTVADDGAIVTSPAVGDTDGSAEEREAELVRCAVAAHRELRQAKPFWTW